MRSMKRPSRRLRESVATMLKNGRFLAPPRAKRITTIIKSKKLCWAEKADNYSAQCRTAASGNDYRARNSGRSRALSPIYGLFGKAIFPKKPDGCGFLDDTACFPDNG